MASYMHGAVLVNADYMLDSGGIGLSGSTLSQLTLYHFHCNRWTDLAASGKSLE